MAERLTKKKTYAANFDGRITEGDYTAYAETLRPRIQFRIQEPIANNQLPTAISSSLSGDYNFDNIMAAVALGIYFGLSVSR